MSSVKPDNDTDKDTDTSAQAETCLEFNDNKPKLSSDSLPNNCTVNSLSTCSSSSFPSKYIRDLNEFITCNLCKGYLVDATTIIECLHSFCRACIVKYMEQENNESRLCPKCNVQIHKTKPKQNIRSDPTLQDIVYKLVPKLYKNEMKRRKEFYFKHPDKTLGLSNEEKGEIHGERLILSTDDNIQLTIEYFPEMSNPYKLLPFKDDENLNSNLFCTNQRRFLLCKAGMKVLHLKKFIRYKYDLDLKIQVDFFYKHELLKDDYTIMDLAYIYSWRRNIPIPLYYIIIEPNKNEDFIWLFSQPKPNLPLPTKTPKKNRLIKPMINCNSKLTPQPHLVSKRNLILDPSKSSINQNFTTCSTSTNSGTNGLKATQHTKHLSLKRKENSNCIFKTGKKVRQENASSSTDCSTVDSCKINKRSSPSDDDSSTDISETSFQIELPPNNEPTSTNNEMNQSINIISKLEKAENAKENHSNLSNQNIKFNDKESINILKEGKDGSRVKIENICSNLIQKVEQSVNSQVQSETLQSSPLLSGINKVKVEPIENHSMKQIGSLTKSANNENSLEAVLKINLPIKSNKSNETCDNQPLLPKKSELSLNSKAHVCLEDKQQESNKLVTSKASNESLSSNSTVQSDASSVSSNLMSSFLSNLVNLNANSSRKRLYPTTISNSQTNSITLDVKLNPSVNQLT